MAFRINWIEQVLGKVQSYRMETPFGILLLHVDGELICSTDWQHEIQTAATQELLTAPVSFQQAFSDYLRYPDLDIPFRLRKQGTVFQRNVWQAIAAIPFGETRTYSELASALHSGARAIGNACRANPFPYIIPCHRVVAKHGLGGYSGHTSGRVQEFKQQLLGYERNAN